MSNLTTFTMIWFLAIGSVMNPTALRLRGVKIYDTRAAVVCKGFKRSFFGKRGMASLVRDDHAGALHSVAHLLDAEGVKILDSIEVGYDKIYVRAKLLPRFGSGKDVLAEEETRAFSYAMTAERLREVGREGVTSRRYLDLLIEGLEEAGGHPQEVAYLDLTPSRPRKRACEMLRIPEAAVSNDASCGLAREFTAEEVHASAGKAGAKDSDLLFVFDGRVIRKKQRSQDDEAKGAMWFRSIKKMAGTDITLRLCQIYLEPHLSPSPWSWKDLNAQYIRFVEDVASRGPYQLS